MIGAEFIKPHPEQWDMEDMMIEDDSGEWVKREDIEGILQYKDQLQGYKLEAEGLKCNCEYESERREGFSSKELLSWICPAHGYKKR